MPLDNSNRNRITALSLLHGKFLWHSQHHHGLFTLFFPPRLRRDPCLRLSALAVRPACYGLQLQIQVFTGHKNDQHSGLDAWFAPNAQQYVLSCPEESRIIRCTPGERKTVNLPQDTFPSGTRPRVARSLRARERPPRCGWTSVWNRDIGFLIFAGSVSLSLGATPTAAVRLF
ncbi:unnamed protein product, partial [Ectocarpus sp. 12 AP-2014]